MSYTEWLNNEYGQWVRALQESTVDNFKQHPMVKRMLGNIDDGEYVEFIKDIGKEQFVLTAKINEIGGAYLGGWYRFIYYAKKVLQDNPTAIVEIGGGVGQFYAVLRALGYKGSYFIYDLPEVKEFQRKYLDRVTELTGLNTDLGNLHAYQYCVSFYALGEFDDELKRRYIEGVVKNCKHGLIIWNPHSGASEEIGFDCKIEDEFPLTSLNNKMLTW